MRILHFLSTGCLLLAAAMPAHAAISQEDAVARAQSAGFSLVSRAESAPGNWDLWASKDGIPYEVKIDSQDGSLLQAIPLEAND